MNPKVIAIVGLSVALAVSGGVIAATSNASKPIKRANTAPTVVADTVDDPTDGYYDNGWEESFPAEDPVTDITEYIPNDEGDSVPTGYEDHAEPSVPYEEQLITAAMSVQYVVDHSTGAETSPRVVFGESYSYCYASFDSDKRFEMCLDPASGMIRKGTYAIYGDVVSITYDDGTGSEYDILTDEDGNITHIIVSYGDYDVYFG